MFLRTHNRTFKLADLEKLVAAAFQTVTFESWAEYFKHVKEGDMFWDTDGLKEDCVEHFVIELGADDEENDADVLEVDGEDNDFTQEYDNLPEMDPARPRTSQSGCSKRYRVTYT